MHKLTETQLSICRMKYKQGRSMRYISSKNGLSEKEINVEIKSILRKVGVTSQYAAVFELTKAEII
jgi:DNA-binding NarL/FixJ family response regulator